MKTIIISFAEGEFDAQGVVVVNDDEVPNALAHIAQADTGSLFEFKVLGTDRLEDLCEFIDNQNQ